ncbi:MAG: hypothetical protein QME68_03955 [Elusimicrobiota bacterium]|nr:hypothetical protein [Elusimicrobiota bacterium]
MGKTLVKVKMWTTPLLGQIVLEDLDIWIDSKNGKLMPNPESPDMPMLDEL